MSFERRQEMVTWFSDISKEALDLDFDFYYLCLMIGFASLRDDKLEGGSEMVKHFPQKFASSQKLIVGLLLIAEMQKLGKDLNKKSDVEFLVSQYLDETAGGSLKAVGFERLNNYANGGFNYLADTLPKPRVGDVFFANYYQELTKLTQANPFWAGQAQIAI